MKTLIITDSFDAYPSGTKLRSFRKGEEVEVSEAFAKIVVDKGLGRSPPPEAKPSHSPAAKAATQEDTAP